MNAKVIRESIQVAQRLQGVMQFRRASAYLEKHGRLPKAVERILVMALQTSGTAPKLNVKMTKRGGKKGSRKGC